MADSGYAQTGHTEVNSPQQDVIRTGETGRRPTEPPAGDPLRKGLREPASASLRFGTDAALQAHGQRGNGQQAARSHQDGE